MSSKTLHGLIAIVLFGSVFIAACESKQEDYQPKVLNEAMAWKSKIEIDIQVAVEEVRKVASSLEAMKRLESPSREDANNLIRKTLENHENYLAVWSCWEPNAFDNKDAKYQNVLGNDKSGRFVPCWNRLSGGINVLPLENYHNNEKESFYQQIIRSGKEMASEPMEYIANGKKQLKFIYAVPINYDDKIIGAAGIDLPLLGFFKPIIRQVRVIGIGYGFLISNNGVLTAHPTKWANVGKTLEFFRFQPDVIQAVKEGREASQIKISKTTGRKSYYQFVPVQIGASNCPWSLAISIVPDWLNGQGPKVAW